MSHTDRCPDRWTAEREGERAQEFGRGRYANPYDDPFHSGRGCEEAERAWNDGYRRSESREEERREEEAAHRRAEMRRAEEREMESYYEQQYYEERQCEPEPFDEDAYVSSECASTGHAIHGSDRFGQRCYCGRVRYAEGPTP